MKILRIYTKLPPLKGGMEKHIYFLTKNQNEFGNSVTIFYNNGQKVSNKDVRISKIKFYKIAPQFIGIIIFYFLISIRLLFKKQKFDLIHIHGDWSSLLLVKIIKKLTKAEWVVLTIHGQLIEKYTHQKLLPKLVQNIDLIFSTGYDTAKVLERLSGKEVIVQPSGINKIFFEKFEKKFDNEKFTIITVANLFPKKNIELIIEIAKELKEFKFVIIGEGSHRIVIEKLIQKNKIANVKLLGFKSPQEVKKYYQTSDCYLLTSFAEGTPTSALEAMSCGLPIVSSSAGGVENIIKDYENGFIINDFDKNKYIDKLKLLSSNLVLRKKIFKNNQKIAENYKWEKVAKNITKLMEKKLNEKS